MNLEQVDAAIRGLGERNQGRTWSANAPLSAAWARHAFASLASADADSVQRAADYVRDVVLQLRAQAAHYRACAEALRHRDPSRLPPDEPGSCRRDVSLLLRRAKDSDAASLEEVAAAFSTAAGNSDAWAVTLTALRDQRDGKRVRAWRARLQRGRLPLEAAMAGARA